MNISEIILTCLFMLTLAGIAVIDAESRVIPDALVIAALVIVLASFFAADLSGNTPDILDHFLGAAFGIAPLFILDEAAKIIFKRDGFGYGDMKLMAVCGLYLGLVLSVMSIFLAFVLCGLFSGILVVLKKLDKNDYIAFGPFICISVFLCRVFGNGVIEWYTELFL